MELFWYQSLTLKEAEKNIIKTAMSFYRNNKAQTARALDISIRSLDYKWAEILEEEASAGNSPKSSSDTKVS